MTFATLVELSPHVQPRKSMLFPGVVKHAFFVVLIPTITPTCCPENGRKSRGMATRPGLWAGKLPHNKQVFRCFHHTSPRSGNRTHYRASRVRQGYIDPWRGCRGGLRRWPIGAPGGGYEGSHGVVWSKPFRGLPPKFTRQFLQICRGWHIECSMSESIDIEYSVTAWSKSLGNR